MWKDELKLDEAIQKDRWDKKFAVPQEFWDYLVGRIHEVILPEFFSKISHKVDEITEINPDLSDPGRPFAPPHRWHHAPARGYP